MDAIIYTSNTGNTKKYAEMLGEKLSKPVFALSKAPSEYNGKEIIYLGWVLMSAIQGLADALNQYDVKAVCAVGMSPAGDEEAEKNLVEKNSVTVPFFYLPGGFSVKKLSGMYKFMMNMVIKKMESDLKAKEDVPEKQRKFLAVINEGIDLVDEANLNDIIAFFTD